MDKISSFSKTTKAFHESRDSQMDKKLPKRSFFQKYRFYLLAVLLVVAILSYMLVQILGKQKLYVNKEKIEIANVEELAFLDYVEAEGIVQPIQLIKLYPMESGMVKEVVAEEGMMMQKGDVIMILQNTDLERAIEEQQDEWEKQQIIYQERKLEMKQKTLLLKQQMLQARYEYSRTQKDIAQGEEEFKMGVKSLAQLEIQREEYAFKTKNIALQLEGLMQDSASVHLRQSLMESELERARKKQLTMRSRLDNLVVRAPLTGQLSYLNVVLGQQIGQSENIGEIKLMDNFKISSRLNEYYIDKLQVGLPATIKYQAEEYTLRVSKVVPEIKERDFEIDLVITGEMPKNMRIGKSYRVKIELGQAEPSICIARGDFLQHTGGKWIYKLNKSGDRAIKVPLVLGRQNPVQYEIIEGLQAGDKVVISGYANLGETEELIIK